VRDDLLLSNEFATLGYRDEKNQKWVLTKDGWICKIVEHEHKGLTRLFRLLRIKDIHYAKYTERAIGKISRNSVYLLFVLSILMMFLTPFYWGIDVFINGCVSEGISIEDCYFIGGKDSDFEFYVIFFPVFLWLVVSLISIFNEFKYLSPDEIKIEHKGGVLLFDDCTRYGQLGTLWFIALLWRYIFDPLSDGFSTNTHVFFSIVIVIILFAMYKYSQSIFTKPKIQEVRFGTIKEFYGEIKNGIGMSEEDSGNRGKRLIDIIGEDIQTIKESIEKYRDELEQIDDKFEDMWESPSFWMGIVSTRTTTEQMLKRRLRSLNPSAERKGRGYTQYMQSLNNLEAPPSEIRNKMKKIAGSWDHAKDAKKEDYIVTLRDAQNLIEWNYTNPPKRIHDNEVIYTE